MYSFPHKHLPDTASFQPAMSDDISILPGLSPVCGLDVHARFDGGRISSNGGALMLREAGRGLGLAEMLASRIEDRRDPAKTTHSDASMIQARIVAIACGHEVRS